jgi:hypothetical protein
LTLIASYIKMEVGNGEGGVYTSHKQTIAASGTNIKKLAVYRGWRQEAGWVPCKHRRGRYGHT